MNKLVFIAAIVLVMFATACSKQTQDTYQAPPQQPPPDTEQQQQPPQQQPQQEPVTEPALTQETPQEEGVQDQFYYVSRLHWPHMPVTYFIEDEEGCGRYETNRIRRAFRDISNATSNAVLFMQANDSASADIEIRCTFIEDCYKLSTDVYDDYVIRTETICPHQLGITKTVTESDATGSRLVKAYIEMVGLAGFAETKREGPSGFYVGTCGHTTTEVHELLHAFGYGHSEDNSSIMNPEADVFSLTIQKEGACRGSERAIDAGIAAELISTYSGKS